MKCPYVIKMRWLVNSNQLVGGPCYIHLQGPRKDSSKPRWEPQTSNRLITSFVLCSVIPSERLRDWNSLKLRWSSNEAHIASEWVSEGIVAKIRGRYQPPSVLRTIFRIPCYVGLLPSFSSTQLQRTTAREGRGHVSGFWEVDLPLGIPI